MKRTLNPLKIAAVKPAYYNGYFDAMQYSVDLQFNVDVYCKIDA